MLIKQSAFTLIEILVVATIIIILTTISIASFSTANKSARDAKRKSDLETIRQAMVLYKTQNGAYPAGNAATVKSALEGGFISPPFPMDPISLTTYQVGNTATNSFCFCATMSVPGKGNHDNNTDCATGAWAPSGYDYQCVRQP